jgi:hypothetical protein
MRKSVAGLPTTRRVVILLGGGCILILGELAIVELSKIEGPPEWIATTAKYVGLILASGLGLVGTATETKEKLPQHGGHRMTYVGWIVAAGIMASLIVGALGQYFEDATKQTAEEKQIAKLESLTQLARRSLARYSGRLEGTVEFELPSDQPQIRDISVDYGKKYPGTQSVMNGWETAFPNSSVLDPIEKRYREEIGHLTCRVSISAANRANQDTLEVMNFELASSSLGDVQIVEFDQQKRIVRAIVRMKAYNIENFGVFSVADFGGKRVTVTYYDIEGKVPNGGRARSEVRGHLKADITRITLIDSDLATVLTRVKLTRYGWPHGAQVELGADYVGLSQALMQ